MCSNPCEIHRPSRRLWDGRDSGVNRLLLRTLCIVLAIAGEFWSVQQLCAQSEYSVVTPVLKTKTGKIVSPLEFPAVDSEERFWACLVSSDPINRRGVLRWEQRDRMFEFELLPYAPLFYRGAPACLADIPTGTMLEVWGYGDEKTNLPRNILRMSDDFSVKAFQQQVYKVDAIDADKKSFQASLVKRDPAHSQAYVPADLKKDQSDLAPDSKPVTFSFNDQTDWYIGNRLATHEDLSVGQTILTNFIRKFYDGPPLITRCTEVWLDLESQDLATRKQFKAFQSYQRDRGFPLRVDRVDDAKKLVEVTLLETGWNDIFREWKPGTVHDFCASTTQLRTWEPNGGQSVPDRMFGIVIQEIKETPIGYGNGGVSMLVQVPRLYEAYRPGTIIKLYPSNHPVPILPIEERLPKEFDTFLRP